MLATGRLPRLASAALVATVVPGSLGGHLFWTETDPERKAQQRRDFLTDLSLLGGLMIASVDTEGKPSLGWRGRRAAKRASEAVSAALPVGTTSSGALVDTVGEKVSHRLQTGAERGRELADVREAGRRYAGGDSPDNPLLSPGAGPLSGRQRRAPGTGDLCRVCGAKHALGVRIS